ncbi:hypothetical protein AJ80_09291 [Polytolypa hystricis UAMH7299]|uniref:Uncharacterized protein n=1 Tax=Polytolypa hystricis (strain UAMH7299) TaxID=1447883 RepID=A0A2B7WT85_POLH7|nr:hypothetical protein AJ80_09291 [Polytolypa hystricis UAMH7299]
MPEEANLTSIIPHAAYQEMYDSGPEEDIAHYEGNAALSQHFSCATEYHRADFAGGEECTLYGIVAIGHYCCFYQLGASPDEELENFNRKLLYIKNDEAEIHNKEILAQYKKESLLEGIEEEDALRELCKETFLF